MKNIHIFHFFIFFIFYFFHFFVFLIDMYWNSSRDNWLFW